MFLRKRLLTVILLSIITLPFWQSAGVAMDRSPKRIKHLDSNHGSDLADGGSPKQAWASFEYALRKLRAGERLMVAPGHYLVSDTGLLIEDLGGVEIVSTEPGQATLDAGWVAAESGQLKWQEEGDGIYSAACGFSATDITCAFTGNVYLHNYRYPPALKASLNRTEGYHRGGEYFAGPEHGIAFTHDRVFLRLPQRASPHGKSITLVQKGTVVRIKNSPGLKMDGFVIRGRHTGIDVAEDSQNTVIRNCIFLGTTTGINYNADNGLVEWCEISLPGLTAFNDELIQRKSLIYNFMKDRSLESGLITSNRPPPSPRNMEARFNYIHDVFDGDNLGSFDDSSIHHSVYGNCFDNAVELEPPGVGRNAANLRFHHNWVQGMYRGAVSHQHNGLTQQDALMRDCRMTGPHLVDHNVIILEARGKTGDWAIWTAIKSRYWDPNIKVSYLNNFIWARAKAELFWNSPQWEDGTRNMTWENNVIVFAKGLKIKSVPFQVKANILVSPQACKELVGPKGAWVSDCASLNLIDMDSFDLRPTTHSVLVSKEHPGGKQTATGPFSANHPPLTDWPRPHRTAFHREAAKSDVNSGK